MAAGTLSSVRDATGECSADSRVRIRVRMVYRDRVRIKVQPLVGVVSLMSTEPSFDKLSKRGSR